MEREESLEIHKWKLEDIYASQEEWDRDFAYLESIIDKYSYFRGNLKDEEVMREYNKFDEEFSRIYMNLYLYSYLGHDTSLKDTRYETNLDKIDNLGNKLAQLTAYLSPEFASLDNSYFLELLKKEEFKDYRLTYESIMDNKKHTLSEKEEEALATTDSFSGGFHDIYNTLIDIDMVFPSFEVDGKQYKLTDELFGLYMSDKNREVREKAYTNLYNTYKQFAHTFAKLFTYHLKMTSSDLKLRKFSTYLDGSLEGSRIPKGVYYNLVNKVSENVDVMKEYFKLLAKETGIDDFKYYDSYVSISSLDKKFDYQEQEKIVRKALSILGEEYSSLLNEAFTKRWIDVYPSDTKAGGGYQYGSYDTHPYVFLNNTDDYSSMSTLAHELGHAMHSYYSNKNQPYITHNYSLFVAEVASTVNEILLNRYMIANSNDIDEKIYYIDQYVKQIKSTVFRQTMFSEFEERMHYLIENDYPLNLEMINKEYKKVLDKHFEGAISIDERLEHEWIRIGHFYRPFYVYKYATSYTTANYIATCIIEDKNNMREKYFELLKSGGNDYPNEILKKVGVDLETDEPYDILFADLEGAISSLKQLLKEKKKNNVKTHK